MGRVMQGGRYNPITVEPAISLAVGLIASPALLLSMMIPSGGTEPRGVCDHVVGTGGLLPLNHNEGGSIIYSCDPDFVLLSLYIFFPAAIVTSVWFLTFRFVCSLFGR